jgi:acetyltransferase-like isoleucine patch superfamily enzyme
MQFKNNNSQISKKSMIGENVKIGPNTIIYDNVFIGDNSIIGANCILGEPISDFYEDEELYNNPKLTIGKNAIIRSNTIIYAGSDIKNNFQTGHNVVIRERMKIGNNCSVGTFSDLQGFSRIGEFCRLHSNVHVGQGCYIEDFVFMYPYVVLTNDPHPPSNLCKGSSIGKYTQIAVHSVILPDSKIGENCLIGANSTVSGVFENEQLIIGSPAKSIGNVKRIKSKINGKEGDSYYPWMYNFDRGMPWEGIGFENWKK